MKGLILKDLYMMAKYCKSYLFIAAIFIAVSFFGNDNLFFIFYPCLLYGMIPVNLLAYDEQSRFLLYSGTLPYTKAQIVSGKYIVGIIAQSAMLAVIAVSQAIKMAINGSFNLSEYLAVLLLGFCVSALVAPLSLPFMFKFGTEKGRMVYFFMVGIVCAGGFASSALLENGSFTEEVGFSGFLPLICAVCLAVYALSWYLSIVFYRKREV